MKPKPTLCHCGKPATERVNRWFKCAECAEIYKLNRKKARVLIQERCGVPERCDRNLRKIARQVEDGFAAFCKRHGLDRRKMYL